MAKISRVSLARKKELEQPDKFVAMSGRLLMFGKTNLNLILIGCGVFVAMIVLVAGYQYLGERTEAKASVVLAETLVSYNDVMLSKGPVEALKQVEPQFLSFVDDYSGTTAGQVARLKLVNAYYAAGEYDKAITSGKASLEALGSDSQLTRLVISSLAYTAEAKGDFKQALQYFNQLVDADAGTLLKADAWYHQGLIHAAMGNTDERDAAFQKIIDDYPDFQYIEIVKGQLTG